MKSLASGLMLLAIAAGLVWSQPAQGADARALEARGGVEAVTVYRGQALVTRTVPIDGPAGPVDLVVPELPERILPETLHASSDDAEVRAIRYRTRAVREELRDDVRQLTDEIEQVQTALRANQAGQDLAAQRSAYLDNLEKFTAAKTDDEMNKGTLNAETITKLTQFFVEQRTELSAKALDLKEEARKLQERLSLLERQRSELTKRLTHTAREAILTLGKSRAGPGTVRLKYLVSEASWSPMYNLRAEGDRKEATVECNAQIQQMSGEDWDGVGLTLSTASPAMVAEPPLLTPLWVTLASGPQAQTSDLASLYRGRHEAASNLRQAVRQRSAEYQAKVPLMDQDWAANTWANRLQFLDMVAGRDVLLADRDVAPTEEALSVNYALSGRISLPSRSDQQLVQIAAPKLPAESHYVAAPLLTPYVYQQALISNTSDVAMLSGPANAYLDGQFMGKGQIPMVAKGQRFLAGFGVDSQLRAKRELADKDDRINWGNRELTFTYRLIIENYKSTPVKVRVMDRLPTAKGADIRVALLRSSDPVSENKVYQRTLRKLGILQWEIDVPAKSEGESARLIEYTYKVEFDKNLNLSELREGDVEKEKLEFRKEMDAWLVQ